MVSVNDERGARTVKARTTRRMIVTHFMSEL
jgi:hypothetical protein